MSNPSGGILVANNIPNSLITVEVGGRTDDGKFMDLGVPKLELSHGEFHELTLPENGFLQIFVKDD